MNAELKQLANNLVNLIEEELAKLDQYIISEYSNKESKKVAAHTIERYLRDSGVIAADFLQEGECSCIYCGIHRATQENVGIKH
jgi:hypothetical protein